MLNRIYTARAGKTPIFLSVDKEENSWPAMQAFENADTPSCRECRDREDRVGDIIYMSFILFFLSSFHHSHDAHVSI